MTYITDSFNDEVIRLLQGGAVGFMPSDTIYGLSAQALNQAAVERVRRLKGRGDNKLCIVLISNIEMLDLLSIDKKQAEAARNYWPGPLTLECQAPAAPVWLQLGLQYFGVRMPGDNKLLQLIAQTGPLISTSANKEGQRPASSVSEAKEIFGDELDFYVNAGPISGSPSTLVRQVDGALEVIRAGAVRINEKETR